MTLNAAPPAPDLASEPMTPPSPTIVPENETPEELNQRLLYFANQLKQLPPEFLQLMASTHPQRNIPQIILVIAIHINNISLVEWVGDNHLHVLSQIISPDTWSVLNNIGFPIPS